MISAILLFAVSQQFNVGTVESWNHATQDERRATIKRITSECKVSPSTLRLRPNGEVQLMPSPDAPYDRIECTLKKMNELIGFAKVGFVGNEAVAEEKK